jgi:hypothetical protein
MPILIDTEEMCVRYRHGNINAIWNLMAIEFTHTAVVATYEHVIESYERFTDYELKMLYLNLCGQKYTGFARDALITTVRDLILSLPESELNGLELSIQASTINDIDNFYRYIKGSNKPQKQEERYVPPALTSVAGYVPAPAPPKPASAAPAQHTQAASTYVPQPRPSTVVLPAEAPKAGSLTGEVWVIAEQVYQENGKPSDFKSIRKIIVDKCVERGINASTASVQFGKWKSTK